jgi:hypothetical protein
MFSFFNTNVKAANAQPFKNIEVRDFVKGLTSEMFRIQTEKVRQFAYDTKEYSEAKTQYLNYFTPHGVFSVRNNKSLLKHSQLFMFDYDLKANPGKDLTEFIKKITERPDVILAFRSVGNGFKFFIKVANVNSENHVHLYDVVSKELMNEYKIDLDIQQGKLSQPCFISYDKEYYYNPR